ncbi:MAG: glutamine-hydrolyzing GMP synthase [Alphaproteobacteria bacterium]|nr:MAG: glutamine-hydrolyzing GMP synthase [Alphaproteobacteria bacterium]
MTHSVDKILIVDFGSQVTQLIARRVRESGVYSEIVPFNKVDDYLEQARSHHAPIRGIILSGGPASVHEDFSPHLSDAVLQQGVPILGICYGMQLLCQHLGGSVVPSAHREFGRAHVEVARACALFEGVWNAGQSYVVWMSHGDRVAALPEGFAVVAHTPSAPYAAVAHEAKRIYAVQFHPEVMHTPDGAALLRNFAHHICGCTGSWSMASFKQQAIDNICAHVGEGKVIAGVSGGVDSSVVAALLHEALGHRVTCIFIDTGLLRAAEAHDVLEMFEQFGINLIKIDAQEQFFNALKGVDDPERKRKIIGALFIELFEREAEKLGDAQFLAQGTLYPDVIESISFHGGPSVTIKSHHNVGGLPERMKLRLVEPLRELFKDEVRALGLELGLSERMVMRHPFPGPGLAIRIPGEVTAEKVAILQKADAIYLEEIRKAGLYGEIWQAFAVLLPVRTVGVMGDNRTYDYACALRAVTSIDGMTADYYHFSHEFLSAVANRIINEVSGINRVVYDITSKPPGTIEWE